MLPACNAHMLEQSLFITTSQYIAFWPTGMLLILLMMLFCQIGGSDGFRPDLLHAARSKRCARVYGWVHRIQRRSGQQPNGTYTSYASILTVTSDNVQTRCSEKNPTPTTGSSVAVLESWKPEFMRVDERRLNKIKVLFGRCWLHSNPHS